MWQAPKATPNVSTFCGLCYDLFKMLNTVRKLTIGTFVVVLGMCLFSWYSSIQLLGNESKTKGLINSLAFLVGIICIFVLRIITARSFKSRTLYLLTATYSFLVIVGLSKIVQQHALEETTRFYFSGLGVPYYDSLRLFAIPIIIAMSSVMLLVQLCIGVYAQQSSQVDDKASK